MATSAFRIYNGAKKNLLKGDLDLNAATMRAWLVGGSGNASNYALSTYASLAGFASGGGYDTRSLTTISIKSLASAKQIMMDAADLVWTAVDSAIDSIKYLVVGLSNGKLLGWVHLTDTAFTLATGNTLTIQWNTSGIFTLTGGTT
jgi:hypothetical protein